MIFVLAKLMKQFAEFATLNDGHYNRVHSVSGKMSGELGSENFNQGPKKYSMKILNLSLLSLLVNDLSDLILASGCPCERTLYCHAPSVQWGCCFVVYYVECVFAFVKHLEGDRIKCQGCQKEVGCDADVLWFHPDISFLYVIFT